MHWGLPFYATMRVAHLAPLATETHKQTETMSAVALNGGRHWRHWVRTTADWTFCLDRPVVPGEFVFFADD